MAGGAQTLQFTEPELIPLTLMGLDMVGHCCRHDPATFDAEGAQRFSPQLMSRDPLPAAGIEKGMMARLIGHWLGYGTQTWA